MPVIPSNQEVRRDSSANMGHLVAGGYFLIGCGPVLVWFFSRVAIRPFLVVLTVTR